MKDLIRKILKEEVYKKYPKPTPSLEKLIYTWLNEYFGGSQMYMIKHYEHSYTFEWCNNGKEVMSVDVIFNDNDNGDTWDDNRSLEERGFDNGKLYITQEVVNEMASDIPVRRGYLRYVIEEWFEDTYLGEIQKKMGRNDIYVTEFDINDGDARTCVPPMTKPDDVTEEDMIEHILKNTLFKRQDILKNEEEEPGWIEKTYLEILRNDERDRLRG